MKLLIALATGLTLSFSHCAFAQPSNTELLEELKVAGFPEVQPLSFAVTKQRKALTALYTSKTSDKPLMYAAEIAAEKDGASVFFRAYRPCIPSDKSARLSERIIMVGNQKIEVFYACGIADGSTQTNEVFMIKSAAGKAFVKQQFEENHYVFVRLNNMPVPFHTEGFFRAMAEAGGKAL